MEFIKKLYGELVTIIITFLVGINVMDDMDYDIKLSRSYWCAFISHPYRFIKYQGNPIDEKLFKKLSTSFKKLSTS